MVVQKDLLVHDLVRGDVFCISILKNPNARGKRKWRNQWFLVRYVNYFNLDMEKCENIIRDEYTNMLNRAKHSKSEYTYRIAKHDFNISDMTSNFWKGILKKEFFVNKVYDNVKLPINIKNLNKEIMHLAANTFYSG